MEISGRWGWGVCGREEEEVEEQEEEQEEEKEEEEEEGRWMGRFHGELGGSHRVTNLVNWRFAHGGASPVRRNLSPLIAQLVPPRLYDLRPGPSSFAFPSSLLPSPVSLYIQTHTHTHTHTHIYI